MNSVIIGKGVTTILDQAFAYCQLRDFYCHATTPPSIDTHHFYTFSITLYDEHVTLHVPAGCKAAYETSAWANHFYNIVEMD